MGLFLGCSTASPPNGGEVQPPLQRPVTSIVSAGAGSALEHSDALAEALESAVSAGGMPGAQAAVVFADGSTWSAGAGLAATDVPMRPDHLVALGSVTKAYTATLLVALADAGVLSLDDPLERWVPDPPGGTHATIRQLLTHTSGVASDDASLAAVCQPGECFSYSNGAYGLLGRVTEEADQRAFAASLRARILSPLGLTATFYTAEEASAGEAATGYQAGRSASATSIYPTGEGAGWQAASGGLVATATDAAQFMHALFASEVLTEAGLEDLLDLGTSAGLGGTNECEPGTGMSIGLRSTAHGDAWFHGGFVGYFRAWLEHFPAAGVSIAAVVNSDAAVTPIVDALEEAALADLVVPPPSRAGSCNVDVGLRSDSGETRLLTTDPAFDGFPTISPDGTRFAWISGRDGHNDLFVGSLDGSAVRNVTADAAQDLFPRWSPDGSSIAYSSDVDGDHEIYVVAADGSNRRQLTRNDWPDYMPAWSPDGISIAYVAGQSGEDIHVMRADGSADRVLVAGPEREAWPAWSPDGERIAFESGGVIWIVPAAGGQQIRLPIPQLRVTMFPAWAPADDLLFSSDVDLYSVAADGSNLRRLTLTSTAEESGAWGAGGGVVYQVSRWEP